MGGQRAPNHEKIISPIRGEIERHTRFHETRGICASMRIIKAMTSSFVCGEGVEAEGPDWDITVLLQSVLDDMNVTK